MNSSDQNLLDADPFGFGRFQNTPEGKVIVLWDYENCPVPKGISGLSAIRNIREAALEFGSIDQFEAYCDWSNESSTGIRNDLSISGVKVGHSFFFVILRDCPTKGWIGTVSKAIVVDMMVYALERPRTTTVLLISGDKDHAYAISTLRNRGYPVKLVAPTGTLHPGLQVFADLLDWNSIFRSDLPPTELVDLSGLAGGEEEETEEDEETSEEEGEDEGEDEDEEEEMETEETTQVQVEAETEVEETAQLQAEAQKKAQVLVEIDKEADPELALLTPPQSEPVATLAPTGIPPMWAPAEPAVPPKVVPLEPLSALAQGRQEEKPRLPPSLYRTPPPPLPYQAPSRPTPHQAVPPSIGAGSSQPRPGYPLQEQPTRPIPAKFSVLVQELKALNAEGFPNPLWSAVCDRVYKRLPGVLTQAGVMRWKEYMLLAEKEGIVKLTMKRPGRDEAVSLMT